VFAIEECAISVYRTSVCAACSRRIALEKHCYRSALAVAPTTFPWFLDCTNTARHLPRPSPAPTGPVASCRALRTVKLQLSSCVLPDEPTDNDQQVMQTDSYRDSEVCVCVRVRVCVCVRVCSKYTHTHKHKHAHTHTHRLSSCVQPEEQHGMSHTKSPRHAARRTELSRERASPPTASRAACDDCCRVRQEGLVSKQGEVKRLTWCVCECVCMYMNARRSS
jgi:hypothetical protein